jgi:hypothetical protein
MHAGWLLLGPDVDESSSGTNRPRSEFQLWHLHDAGGPVLHLKVRYRDEAEVPDWRDGPELPEALELAAADGWQVYDHEPGSAPGEYAILHLKRALGWSARLG